MRRPAKTSARRCGDLAPLTLSISLALLYSASVHAQQDTPATQESDTTRLDAITVTGSRIPRQGFVTPTPVTVLNAEDIRASGAVTIGELLIQLPQLATTFSLGNSSRFIGAVGVNLLDLRNLGPARTLVLVNGRRHVGASPGDSSPDVNTIPVEWIERVEIITGGASAIYGADAVAGVVNFVLKESFEGYSVRAQTGISDEGGFGRWFGSFTGGGDFADGRGSIGVSVEVSDQDRFLSTDREFSQINSALIANPNPPPGAILTPNASIFSFTEGGVFALPDGSSFVFDPDGSFRPQRFDGPVDAARGNCVDCDFLDLAAVAELQPEFRRESFNTHINFELNPNHKLFFEGKYARTESEFFTQPAFGTYVIPRDNAFISPELGALMDQQGLDTLAINRFDVDAGLRGENVIRETVRVAFGIEGQVAENWNYELSGVYGRSTEDRENLNNRITERFFASIDAVVDPNTGQVVCRSTVDPGFLNLNNIDPVTGLPLPISAFGAQGCVPTSIFGNGAVSPEAAAVFNTTTFTRTELEQRVLSASISQTELFNLPAGPVGFAAGLEYRKEQSEQQTDPLDQAGLTFLNAIPNQGGEYDVSEAFAEFSIPLLAGIPAVDSLILDVAGRASDYSTVGNTFSWKAGLDWTIAPSVRLRSTYSKAVRAPNIGELFDPQAQNFAVIDDPCAAINIPNAPNPGLRQANCNVLGIPADFVAEDDETFEGVSGGNPELNEEEAETFTAGIVFTPGWLPNFGLTIDYWDISIDDVIAATDPQTQAERCVDAAGGTDNEFCPNIQRDPITHQIILWTAIQQNLSKLEAAGIDIEANYRFEQLFGGQFNLRLIASYLDKSDLFPFQAFPDEVIDQVGTIGFPEWRATLSAQYRSGPWQITWRTRYVDRMLRVTNEVFEANPTVQSPIETPSQLYTDLQLNFTIDEGIEVYFGVDNLFDKLPPPGFTATGADIEDGGTGLFDNIGRFYYLGWTFSWN